MSMATGPSADDVIGSLLRLFTFLHSATESGMSVEPREQPAQCSCKHMFTLNLCNCLPQLKVHSWGQFVEKAMTSCNGCHCGVCARECVCWDRDREWVLSIRSPAGHTDAYYTRHHLPSVPADAPSWVNWQLFFSHMLRYYCRNTAPAEGLIFITRRLIFKPFSSIATLFIHHWSQTFQPRLERLSSGSHRE